MGALIFFGILAVIVLVTILKTAIVVPQKTAYIVERLGKYSCTLDAGFHNGTLVVKEGEERAAQQIQGSA